jgi:CPA2 family monovalent cation:H+ antiporter-2
MMLAIPILSGESAAGSDVVLTLAKALGILAAVVLVARLLMPRIMDYVASTRQRHLFTLAMVLICLGTAWLITKGGVSLPLGAFLAGMVVAGSEFRHQAMADLTSFRDVFSSLFFVSIGMLLNLQAIAAGIVPILLILGAILIGKFLIVSTTGLLMKLPIRVSVLAGVALSQVGEFSFVLDRAADGTGLIPQPLQGQIIAAAILSMLITPFALSLGPRMAAGVGRIRALTRLLKVRDAVEATPTVDALRNHVIIGGYGFAGVELAKALRRSKVPYVIVDLNVDNVRKAVTHGEPAYYGDITSEEVLESLGIHHARELVIVINDSEAVQRAVLAARKASPNTHIVARTNYLLNYDHLRNAGATEVVSAELAAATEVAALVLARHGAPEEQIEESCDDIRSRTHE